MKIAKKLFEYRTKKELTMEKMADLLGVPYRTYQDWEDGMRVPTPLSYRYLHRFLLENDK